MENFEEFQSPSSFLIQEAIQVAMTPVGPAY